MLVVFVESCNNRTVVYLFDCEGDHGEAMQEDDSETRRRKQIPQLLATNNPNKFTTR